eukprot:6463395-Amphidinium_carterae.1
MRNSERQCGPPSPLFKPSPSQPLDTHPHPNSDETTKSTRKRKNTNNNQAHTTGGQARALWLPVKLNPGLRGHYTYR